VVWVGWPVIRTKAVFHVVRGGIVAVVMFCMVMSPWWIRNAVTLHAFVPTRSNLPIELYESTRQVNDGFQWGTTLPLWPGDPEFKKYASEGEIQFGREKGAAAKVRMRAMKGQMAAWSVQRFFFFWDGTPHPLENHPANEYGRELSYAFLSACGLLGLALMLWRKVEGAGLFALVFLLMPVPYYLVTVQARFRHPIEPLIAILAVYLFRSTEKREARNG
jgi:hypothetical protein